MIIPRREWKKRFKNRLVKRADIKPKFAEEIYQQALQSDMIDFEDTPEDSADDELSYWNG